MYSICVLLFCNFPGFLDSVNFGLFSPIIIFGYVICSCFTLLIAFFVMFPMSQCVYEPRVPFTFSTFP